jgi:hypothetical protein
MCKTALKMISEQGKRQQREMPFYLFIYFIYIRWILTWLEKPVDMEIVKNNRTHHKNHINT